MQGLTPLIKMSSGCDYHRILLPLRDMGVDENQWAGKNFGDLYEETKVLWYNRVPAQGVGAELLEDPRKKYGFKIVVDLDDYWELYPGHILYNHWYANKINIQMQTAVKLADAVIVTTSLLADKVRPLNKNVYVIPNALPYDTGQFTNIKQNSDNIRFLYAGGSSHFQDIQVLKKPFDKVRNNPKLAKAEFLLAGVDKRNKWSLEFWEKMERSFGLNGRLPNFTSRMALDLEQYMGHYDFCDVNLAPLQDFHFNYFKSNLKVLEGASRYAPCIASDVPPYSVFPDRNLVMYGSNAATWFDHIKKCATDPVYVQEKGQALGEYCREHFNLPKVNQARIQLFEHLMS